MKDCNVHHMTTGGVCRDCGTPWSAMTTGQHEDAVLVATPPTPDPRERGDDEQYAAYSFVPSDPELALALDSAAKMAREADEKFCAAFGGDGETSAFWLTAAVSEIRAALSRQAHPAPAPSEAVAEVATDGGHLRWRLNGTDPLDSIELGLPSGTWISVHGNNGVAVTVERVQAWARLLTHPAPARGVTEDMVMIPRSLAHKADGLLSLVGHRHKVRGVGADAAEFIEASLEFRAALTLDAEGGA